MIVPLAVDDNEEYFTPKDIKSPYYTPRPLKCPSCRTGVIPRVNGKIVIPHFAHVSSTQCRGGEGFVHKVAKETIASCIQNYTFVNTCTSCGSVKSHKFDNDKKCGVEVMMGNFIVDVGVMTSSDEKYGAIEIHHTNAIDDIKSSYLSKKLNDRVFEVEAWKVLNGDLEMHSSLKCSRCNPCKFFFREKKLHVSKMSKTNAVMDDARDRQLFVQQDFIPGKKSVLSGTAGSGKTSLIEELIRKNPDKNFLFTCFNKSLQEETKERFYSANINNVDVFTFDSIWWKMYHGNTRRGNMRPEWTFKYLSDLNEYLDGFRDIDDFDSKVKNWMKKELEKETWWTFKRMAKDIYDSKETSVQDMISKYDVLVCDEAQDMQPMTFRIVDEKMNRHVHVVYAGDPCQQLYAFNGAIDVMTRIIPDEMFVLHKTFRFGNDACNLLNESRVNKYTTFSDSHKTTPVVRYSQFSTHELASYVFLFRSVCGMVQHAERLAKGGYLVKLDFEKRVKELMREKRHMELCIREGKEIHLVNLTQTWLSMLDKARLNDLNELFSRMSPGDDDVHIEFSTVHKYKGKESDVVRVAEDVIASEDVNIVNVALSRARKLLVLP